MDGGMDIISKLPHELLQNIFKYIDPSDLAPIKLTCKEFCGFITKNASLFKEIYIQLLDEPKGKAVTPFWDWEDELHKFDKFRRILGEGSYDTVEKKMSHIKFISDFVSTIVQPMRRDSQNSQILINYFERPKNKEAFLCQSITYVRSKATRGTAAPTPSFEERQASAKLHTLYGVPIRCFCHARYKPAYPYAVSMVYDLRNYTDATFWGPFLPDGQASVDWEKMEAVMIVLGHNLKEFSTSSAGIFKPLWTLPWYGCSPDTVDAMALEKKLELEEPEFEDPYHITGTWMRLVCFLDFHELFHYNFTGATQPAHLARPPLETVEAIRLIMMDLHVTKKEAPGPEDGQDYPIVHFYGTARSMHASWDPNANSNIRGTVRQTKEGEIRWTSISVYNGEERWKSEGIQIGGPKSARGVLGHWFDREFDLHGPAGPTAFWKISNDINDQSAQTPPPTIQTTEEQEEEDDTEYDDSDTDEEENGDLRLGILMGEGFPSFLLSG